MLVYVGCENPTSVDNYVTNNTNDDSSDIFRVCSVLSIPDSPIDIPTQALASSKTRELKLKPGERRGWWSKHKYDRRTRMTSTVYGAIDDKPAKILLDSGANVSIINTSFARKLGLLKYARKDAELRVQGISNLGLQMNGRIDIKITLGHSIVYFYEVWISDHHAGVDLLLGVDFLMSAGIRLDLYLGRATLPDEVRIPLNNVRDVKENQAATRVRVGPTQTLQVPANSTVYFRTRLPANWKDLVLWVGRKPHWVPTVVRTKTGTPRYIRVTNLSDQLQLVYHHQAVAYWVEKDHIPTQLGYVREQSCKYKEWQVLAFEGVHSKEFEERLEDEFDAWVKANPPLPNKPSPPSTPITKILQRSEANVATLNVPLAEETTEAVNPIVKSSVSATPNEMKKVEVMEYADDMLCSISSEEELLGEQFVCMSAQQVREMVEADCDRKYKHESSRLYAEDLAGQLAMLPDIEDLKPEQVDLDQAHIGDGNLTGDQVEQVKVVLQKYQDHLMGGGNALPKPAKGVICDIDVGNHPPISLPARRVKPEVLYKLFELLKTLLQAKLIKVSRSEWGSPIVIVYKKDGSTIRLCIDYRAVNRITKALSYPMALVDDLLESFEAVMWFCSLDAASGFWAIGMSKRASDISAFVCPLGHFQWTRMPFGLKNAPMIYQRMLDNALWGFVKPVTGWENIDTSRPADSAEFDEEGRQLDVFDTGIAEDSNLVPIFWKRSFVDDIAFGAETFETCLLLLDRLLARLVQLCICISFQKSLYLMSKVEFLSHMLSAKGIEMKPKAIEALQAFPFPKSKKGVQSFLGSLNYYGKFIQDFGVLAATLYELTDEDFEPGRDLSRAHKSFEMLKKRAVSAPILRHFQSGQKVYIMLFANHWAISATIMQEHEGKLHPIRFVSRVLKQNELNYHIAEKEVLALLRVFRVCYTMLVGQELTVLTQYSSLKWLYTQRALYGRPLQFAVMLSPWTFEVEKIQPSQCAYSAMLTASIVPIPQLEEVLAELAPSLKGKSKVPKVDIPYPLLNKKYTGFLLSFDGSIKKPEHGGYGSCGFVIWQLPEWSIVHAECVYIPEATINVAEYQGLISGLRKAADLGIPDLFVTGDSQIVLTQVTERKECKSPHLQLLLNEVRELELLFYKVNYLHLIRKYNGAADLLATEALKSKVSRIVDDEATQNMLIKLNKLPEAVYLPEDTVVDYAEPPPKPVEEVVACAVVEHEVNDVDEAVDVLTQLDNSLDIAYANVVVLSATTKLWDRCFPVDNSMWVYAATEVNCDDSTDSSDDEHTDIVAIDESTPLGEVPTTSPSNSTQPPTNVPEADTSPTLPGFEPQHFNSYDDPQAVQDERFRRLARAQDEERQWFTLKCYLKSHLSHLSQSEVKRCSKLADLYVLDSLDVLRYVAPPRKKSIQREVEPRLVVPSTLQDELLYLAHASFEGGHQGVIRTYYKLCRLYYWPGMYAAVERYVLECVDCSTGKGKPFYRGSSRGNITPTRPMQVVSMDAAGPFPKSYRGNRYLLLFQCTFTGYVMCKALANLDSLTLAQTYEECVFRRFGAAEILRHDRAPAHMSEAFRLFNQMLGQRQRATLSYRPQANGQQERSVQTVVKTIRQYATDPAQRDWDDLAERLTLAINTSFDFTRKETPFYLIHGWDAKTTLDAMIPAVLGRTQVDAVSSKWRKRLREQHQLALKRAYDLQVEWKAKRAEMHNQKLKRNSKSRTPTTTADGLVESDPVGQGGDTHIPSETDFEVGDAVWMYVDKVKEGLTKKLAHLWHGPFRINKKIDDYCYELELPDRRNYRFYPVVHISRLKPRANFPERPTVELTGLQEEDRFDFDEELLPEDSFVDNQAGDWEVEAVLDDKWDRSDRFGRLKHKYLVKWKGNYKDEWIDLAKLDCPALIREYHDRVKADRRLQMVQLADEDLPSG